MSAAAIAWIILACLIILAFVVMTLIMVPEIRRYLRIKRM
jgi:hypothetical protein